jgi:hypothetical protein
MRPLKRFLGLSLLVMSLIPSGVFGGEFLVSGLPSATSRCRLEGALGGMVRDYLFNHQGQQVMPIAGNTFIVVDFLGRSRMGPRRSVPRTSTWTAARRGSSASVSP